MADLVLAGDVGGTKVNLGLFDAEARASDRPAPALIATGRYSSQDHSSLAEVVVAFLDSQGRALSKRVVGACFGVAGPVLGNKVETPNLPWSIDGDSLAQRFELARFELVNDLVATGEGIAALRPDELHSLQAGQPSDQARVAALIAAGTGLGMGLLLPTASGWRTSPSEGGHVDLAARDSDELELLAFLLEQYPGHVSLDRVISGPGLVHLFEFERLKGAGAEDAQVLDLIEADRDAAPRLISEKALAGSCPVCGASLDRFIKLYGMAAANLVLTTLALGGLYVGGGIAPKILPRLQSGGFLASFLEAGRMRGLLERVPVKVVLNDQAAVLGAARRSVRSLAGEAPL